MQIDFFHLFLLLNGHLHFLVELVDIFLKIIFGSPQVQVLLQTLSLVCNNLRKEPQIRSKVSMAAVSCLVLQLGRHPRVLIGQPVEVLRKLLPHNRRHVVPLRDQLCLDCTQLCQLNLHLKIYQWTSSLLHPIDHIV